MRAHVSFARGLSGTRSEPTSLLAVCCVFTARVLLVPWHTHTNEQQSARERAALWLAVNKLDVLEAAKDAAIKELQVRTA